MARPLRIERPGGRYHVTARGNERRAIFRDDSDRAHLLELLSEAAERFAIRIHAYVLMDNHFHLLVETPEANLSRAMQWLNVSYSVWFNRRHDRAGHLFQGRFRSVVIEDDAGWQEVARYVHLNPVRVAALGLGKRDRSAARQGLAKPPAPGLVGQRLSLLHEFRWSSFRAYAGYGAPTSWLWREPLARLCGGSTEAQRRAAFREYVEQAVRQGTVERPWDRLLGGFVLGTEAFARQLRREVRGNAREQNQLKALAVRVTWPQIVSALERLKREPWDKFCGRHGDWGRDAALWLGRRLGRLKLQELGKLAGGLDYAAVGQAVSRLAKRLQKEPQLRNSLAKLEAKMSNVEM